MLTIQIQGESLLKDGTAMVMFTIAYDMLKGVLGHSDRHRHGRFLSSRPPGSHPLRTAQLRITGTNPGSAPANVI